MKKTNKKIMKESYEVSDELADELRSIASEEFLANEMYLLAERAMKGKKQHLLSEIAKENGKDELEDHFENLCDWMQSKGIEVPVDADTMCELAKGTLFTFDDGESTEDIIENLIVSEEEAIEHYEDVLDMPDCKHDLKVMLAGFLKDEREHLKALKDCRDEMGASEKKPKHAIYERKGSMNESFYEGYPYKVSHIAWDVDDERDLDSLPDTVIVDVPEEVVAADGEEEYISDYLSDEYGFCHNGFVFREA